MISKPSAEAESNKPYKTTMNTKQLLVMEKFKISKDDFKEKLNLGGIRETVHFIIEVECPCEGLRTKKVRIFQTQETGETLIYEARDYGTGIRIWHQVQEVEVRPGEDGCFNCKTFTIKVTDRSVFKGKEE